MKIIGVTGNRGKTSVISMLSKYLEILKLRVGVFDGENVYDSSKNIIKKGGEKDDLFNIIKTELLDKFDFLLVEISFESILYKKNLEKIKYDVMLLTNFDEEYHYNFKNFDHHLEILGNILKNQSKTIIPNTFQSIKLSSKDIKKYGLENDCDYQIDISKNNIRGLEIIYKNKKLKTKLITKLNAHYIIAAISVLEEIEVYNQRKFQKMLKKIKLPGNIERIYIKKKTLILDSTQNIKKTIEEIQNMVGHYNFKVIINNYIKGSNDITKKLNLTNGKELKKTKHIYLVNKDKDFVKEFIANVLDNKSHSLEYLNSFEEAIDKGIRQLKKDELLVVLSGKETDTYRSYMEGLNGTI